MSINAVAQKKVLLNKPKYDNYRYHFGFALGLNTMDFTIHNAGNFLNPNTVYIDTTNNQQYSINSIENIRRPGFNINIVTNLKINENWDLRFTPGLCFGQRDLDYSVKFDVKDTTLSHHVMRIESTFLQFPIYLKYRAKRLNNYRPYIIGGISYNYDLASQKKIKEAEKPKIRLIRSDIYLEMGFGIDYYLTYFKFSTELRFSLGMNDVVKHDETGYTHAIERMNSKIVSLIFYFE